MSTPNFYNKNANLIYACEIKDEYDYEDLVWGLCHVFRACVGDHPSQYPPRKEVGSFEAVNLNEADGLRSYPGRIICRIKTPVKSYRDFDIAVSADIIVRNGYWDGANLDYDIHFHVDEEIVKEDDLDEVCLYSELPGTRRAYQLALAKKWFDRMYGKFTDVIEEVFAEFSTPLQLVARASNGEAIYEKA